MPIRVLSELVASQIAAGEVVERPASVVKELLENSLDAGAHVIRVEIDGGGRRMIRVVDDGSGIPSTEAELAFAPHATSKLLTAADLDAINTFGFRGEALASIASVSQVTLITRTADQPAGVMLQMEGGRLIEHRGIGAPVGTSLTVQNLFFNTPARLKFLKAETTERKHIDQVVTRAAIAYPNVRFSLVQDGRITFSTSGNGSLTDALVEVLGVETMRDMLEVTPTETPRPDIPTISVYGFTSTPRLNRNTRTNIQLFVNGRPIADNSLNYAVTQAYHGLMPAERYPISVLLIALPADEVDVNVHPTKAEVRFRNPDAVFSAVQRAVRKAVISSAPIPELPVVSSEKPRRESRGSVESGAATLDMEVTDSGRYPHQMTPEDRAELASRNGSPNGGSPSKPDDPFGESLFGGSSYKGGMPGESYKYSPGANTSRFNGADRPVTTTFTPKPSDPEYYGPGNAGSVGRGDSDDTTNELPRRLPPMRVIGQAAAMYIIAEGPAGLYLVDQHAAHERVLFEQWLRTAKARQPVAQLTLDGATVELSPSAAGLVAERGQLLADMGFDLEPYGGRMVRVRAVPAMLAKRDPQEALHLILDDLESEDAPGAAELERQVLLRVCKAGAVKAGQVLSYEEMQGIVRALERCENPRTCPHGRPTLILISGDQLAREFGRT